MADRYSAFTSNLSDPSSSAFAVTANDNIGAAFSQPTRGVFVGTGGNIAVVMVGYRGVGNTSITFSNVQSGAILPIRVVQVLATGTTANNIIGLY